MSNKTKAYFLVPGWNIPPSAIQLGNIIAEPTEPHLPLLNFSRPTVQKTCDDNNSSEIDTQIFTNTKTDFSITLSKSASNKFGIFAQFLQIFGLGAEAGVELSSDGADTFDFESEIEEWFTPSIQFVERAVGQSVVQGFLKGSPSRTPLYVITGLRIVKGITAGTTSNREKTISGQVSVDATGAGVPVNVGPTVQHTRGKGEEIKWKCDGPLVFAYQLSRIKPNKSAWKMKNYNKGAFFGINQGQDKIEVGLDDDFLDSLEDVEIQEGADDMDGKECVIVVPLDY